MIKVLIVEDDNIVVAMYDKKLDRNIMDIKFVTDGEEALKVYYGWRPDIILLDIQIPGVSGYTVLKKIRTEYEDHHISIIMATVSSSKEDIMDCMRLGVQGYMVKPLNMDELNPSILDAYLKHHPEKAKDIPKLKKAS